MALKNLPRVVVDTNLWVSYLSDENPEFADKVQSLLDDNGKYLEIILPTIVLAETVGMVRGRASRPEEQRDRAAAALAFFQENGFTCADLDQRTAERAAELCGRFLLKGADASILATAELVRAECLYTNDAGLLKVGQEIEGLSVETAPEPTHLIYRPETS